MPGARRNKLARRGFHRCWSAKILAQYGPSSRISAKKFAQLGPSSRISAKKFPQLGIKHPFWAIFRVLGELLRARTHTPGRAGRTMSRTGRRNMATVKPTTPPLTPNKGPMKPASPLHPKNTPKHPFLTRKGDGGFRQPGHLADRARPRRPRALKPCPAPPFHTWTSDPHVNPMTRAWALQLAR